MATITMWHVGTGLAGDRLRWGTRLRRALSCLVISMNLGSCIWFSGYPEEATPTPDTPLSLRACRPAGSIFPWRQESTVRFSCFSLGPAASFAWRLNGEVLETGEVGRQEIAYELFREHLDDPDTPGAAAQFSLEICDSTCTQSVARSWIITIEGVP
jgi:hypothetical protein